MSDIAIKFENISKQYRLGLVSTHTLSHDLNRWWQTRILRKEDPYLRIGETNDRASKGNSDYVWALKDIDFEVKQGDVLGIIGKNGAGKSTLLKILSRVTSPTTGSIKAKGRIASLLEVGTGFHPELTGRENIYMNGAIMGMTRKEITHKLEEIVEFAGVARYIDTPVKRYSSGMTVRLGFSIAAHLEPDILVVDEVLAVGDAEFQKKAIGKMQDVSLGEGRTVLFVSHNMAAIRNLCRTGIVLEHGTVKYMDSADASIDYYLNSNQNDEDQVYINNNPASTDIKRVDITTINNEIRDVIRFDEPIAVNFDIVIGEDKILSSLYLGVTVMDKQERKVFNKNIALKDIVDGKGIHKLRMIIPHSLLIPNHYNVSAGLHIPNQSFIGVQNAIANFTINDTSNQYFMYQGVDMGCVNVDCKWELFNL